MRSTFPWSLPNIHSFPIDFPNARTYSVANPEPFVRSKIWSIGFPAAWNPYSRGHGVVPPSPSGKVKIWSLSTVPRPPEGRPALPQPGLGPAPEVSVPVLSPSSPSRVDVPSVVESHGFALPAEVPVPDV